MLRRINLSRNKFVGMLFFNFLSQRAVSSAFRSHSSAGEFPEFISNLQEIEEINLGENMLMGSFVLIRNIAYIMVDVSSLILR